MIEKAVCDYVALREMFHDLAPEKERAVKAKVRQMIGTEEYCYLKYWILKHAMSELEGSIQGRENHAREYMVSANIGEEISKSLDIKDKEPRVSFFRGEKGKESS